MCVCVVCRVCMCVCGGEIHVALGLGEVVWDKQSHPINLRVGGEHFLESLAHLA